MAAALILDDGDSGVKILSMILTRLWTAAAEPRFTKYFTFNCHLNTVQPVNEGNKCGIILFRTLGTLRGFLTTTSKYRLYSIGYFILIERLVKKYLSAFIMMCTC